MAKHTTMLIYNKSYDNLRQTYDRTYDNLKAANEVFYNNNFDMKA